MRKTIILLSALLLVLSVFSSCGKNAADEVRIKETVEDTDYSLTY